VASINLRHWSSIATILAAHPGTTAAFFVILNTAEGGRMAFELISTGDVMRRFMAFAAVAALGCRTAEDILNGPLPAACADVTIVAAKSSGVLLMGRATTLAGTAYHDAGGCGLCAPGLRDVPLTWRSLDSRVVAVSPAGVATPAAVGTTKLIATACRISDTALVSVIAKPYTVTPIILSTGASTTGVSLNDSGAVVGTTAQTGPLRNFMWTPSAVTDLGSCIPRDINNGGLVLCAAAGPTLWENGSASARDTRAAGLAMNDSGHVIGVDSGGRGYLWHGPGNISLMQWSVSASALNNRDEMVISSAMDLYNQANVVWQGRTDRILGFGRAVRGLAINDSADVVGSSEWMSGGGHLGSIALVARPATNHLAEVLRPNATLRLANDIAVSAVDINNRREIIGTGSQGPFVWADGKLGLLNQLLADRNRIVTSVQRINNRGQILAQTSSGAVLIDPP
jgi:hypothetical protein